MINNGRTNEHACWLRRVNALQRRIQLQVENQCNNSGRTNNHHNRSNYSVKFIFPNRLMFGKINPKQIEGMMKKMGIAQNQLDVKRVIFEMEDKNLVIDEPSVTQINMQGQTTWQVGGVAEEESKEVYSNEDVEMVVEKTGKSGEEVRDFLEKNNGDIALAILELK